MSWEDLESEIAEEFAEYAPSTVWDDDVCCVHTCIVDGCYQARAPITNSLYCDEHAALRRVQFSRKPSKPCQHPGCLQAKVPGGGGRYCAKHKSERHEWDLARRRRKRALAASKRCCQRCLKRPAVTGISVCVQCARAVQSAYRARKATTTSHPCAYDGCTEARVPGRGNCYCEAHKLQCEIRLYERKLDDFRARRDKALAEGVCGVCLRRPRGAGKQCDECSEKRRARYRASAISQQTVMRLESE